jgi:hypothetical protein
MFGRDKTAKKAAAAAKAAKKAAKRAGRKTDSLLQETGSTVGKVSKRAKKEMAKTAKAGRKEMAKTSKVGRKAAVATAKAQAEAAEAAKKSAARAAKANDKVAKAESKLVKADELAVKSATKSAASTAKAEAKAAKVRAKQPQGLIGQLTSPKTATRALAAAKIVGPAVAPYALQAATSARGFLDERRAQKLGVGADEVAAYRGPTGPSSARIASLRSGIDEVRRRKVTDPQVSRFADVAKARLADLEIATHTAASMPPARRRGTLTAIGRELNQIEADLMTYLVGTR